MSRRIERVNGLLRQEIGRVLATELRDPRLSAMVSVVRVETSPDLGSAKVFVSVLGDGEAKSSTIKALRSAAGYVHRSLRRSTALRTVPSVSFSLDETIERGAELLELIDRVSPDGDAGRAP